MKLSQEKLNTFENIYFDTYGISLNSKETEERILEITQLLEEIIRINYIKKNE